MAVPRFLPQLPSLTHLTHHLGHNKFKFLKKVNAVLKEGQEIYDRKTHQRKFHRLPWVSEQHLSPLLGSPDPSKCPRPMATDSSVQVLGFLSCGI